jgi:putative ABC transport system permease protein
MGTLWQDLQYGWRMLWRSPGFAIVAVLTLAIGIGANAMIFSVLHTVMLRPLPFPDSKRIVIIWETDENRRELHGTASPAEFLDWRDQNHVFEELSAWRALFFTITGNGEPEQEWGAQTSGNFFRLLQVKPAIGRDFLPEEERPGHEKVVILSYRLWQQRYGGDREIIGKDITIDDQPHTIIGVLPRGFSLFGVSRNYDLWVPFAFNRSQLDRGDHELIVFARLQKRVTLPQGQAEMETILARLKKQYPGIDQENGVRVVRFQDSLVSSLRPALLILMAAVGFVLLISCANVANLELARAATREREIAIRAAIGAGRGRILRQLLTESTLLAVIGGVFGILVAYGGLHLLRAVLPVTGGTSEIPHSNLIGIDGAVLGFTLITSLLTGIFFGLAPALQISGPRLCESLKEGSHGSTGGRRSRSVRSALVVSEVALSLILLVAAGLLIRSFVLLMSEDLGFNPSGLLTMQIWVPESHMASGRQIVNFFEQTIERVNALSGVKSASAVNFLPLTGWGNRCEFDIAGRAAPGSDENFTSQYRVVDWKYFGTMRIPVKQGRDLAGSDGPDNAGVALINEALAQRYWQNDNPIGKQIRLQFPATRSPFQPEPNRGWLTIVGVTGDIQDWYWGESKIGQLYLPLAQNPSRIMRLVVRTDGAPTALTSAVRQAVESVDPNQPVTEVSTMGDLISAAVARRRMNMLLLGIFAAVATLLAAMGIYGVMAYAVTQRTHEIGIRMALGAEPGDVHRMIIRDAMKLAGIGLALGMAGSFLPMRYLQTQLYGVKTNDPVILISVAIGLLVVAAAACYFPAHRATRIDPLVALRYE